MKNCIVSSIAETNIITAPTTTSRLRIKFVAGITYHPACYYLSKRDFHVHGSLVAFSKRRYGCMCVNERTKSGTGNEFHRYVIYEKSPSRIFEMDDRRLREIRALCEVNNGASGTSNANDPLKTEIPKRVAIGTESIPPSMID